MDADAISKEDKRKISRMDQVDSVSHRIYLMLTEDYFAGEAIPDRQRP